MVDTRAVVHVSARDDILARVRAALAGAPSASASVAPSASITPPSVDTSAAASAAVLAVGVPAGVPRPGDLERFVDRLVDYKALVTRCAPAEVSVAVAEALAGVTALIVPDDLPEDWLARYQNNRVSDPNQAEAVLTGCAAAVAETGTIVLDGGAAQGRRVITLLPDHHVCVVRADQVFADVPDAITQLRPAAPMTWISGPSATSDIELDRVEGVHGPRRLHVILMAT